MSNNSSMRLHSLDAVRAGALLLGVVFHAAFSFLPGDQIWMIMDSQRSTAISGTAYILHMFRMTIFFLMAGYFGRMQTYRHDPIWFMKDRLKRIGAPLIIFWPIVMACFIGLGAWALITANGGTMPENPPAPPPITLATLPLTHLWFLYALLLLYTAMLSGRALFSLLRVKEPLGTFSDKILNTLLRVGILPILIALPTAMAFAYQAGWHPFFGIPAPEYGFVPNRISVIAYGGAFTLGWLIQRDPKFLLQATELWPIYLMGALGVTGYCLSVIELRFSYIQPLPENAKYLYPLAYALGIWLWTFGLIGLCMKVWSKENHIRRYIADASYWIYLIHIPIVIALQIWVSQWTWPAEIKYAFILAVSIPLMLITYEVFVRYTFIGSLINGQKRSRQKIKIAKEVS
jgi:peptidoglycan/LPS O-acetylase OafA/YrhL